MGRLVYEDAAAQHLVTIKSGVYILSFANYLENNAIKIMIP